MFKILFSLLLNISNQQNQSCENIIIKKCCVDQCEWENEDCQIKKITNYCYLDNLNQAQCISNSQCAFYNGKCEPFFKCQAYLNEGSNCSRISMKCISIEDQILCVDKPENCYQIIDHKYCGQIDYQYGSKESCDWIDDKCQFIGCDRASEFGQPSSQYCQNFHNICKFDGSECKSKLLQCNQYTSNCNNIIAITGKCQFNSIGSKCMNASCYQYMENSFEKCQQHFGQYGTQCIYDNKYFDGLCLEIDYQTQIRKCLIEMPDKSCNNYLSISKCFGINTYKYDQKINFCQENSIERRECETILTEYECNTNENLELKNCQWIKNTCKTINQCSDYVLNLDSTEKSCEDLIFGCKQISCSDNQYGCCIKKQECIGYQKQQECTNNKNNVTKLLDACIWDNKQCRYGKCADFNNDSYQCNNFVECMYVDKLCQTIKQISCNGLSFQDCIQFNCYYIKGKCYDKSRKDKDIKQLSIELNEDEDTVCQYFSDKLMYCSDSDNCRLKTRCQNYDSYYCQSMKQFDNIQCVNINSECKPMETCSQIQFSKAKQCYRAQSFCNSNGKTCETALKLCSYYIDEQSCNFQLDQSICQWNKYNNNCNLKRCEDIEDINNCDSTNLCMDPKLCRQHMCIKYNSKCLTMKSRCSSYKSNDSCYQSIASFCFWDGFKCMDFMTCNIFSITQCLKEQYNHLCIFDYDLNQCRNRKNSEKINTIDLNQTNDSCSSNILKYGYYCASEQDRDQMIENILKDS